jgi:hypothetical protein
LTTRNRKLSLDPWTDQVFIPPSSFLSSFLFPMAWCDPMGGFVGEYKEIPVYNKEGIVAFAKVSPEDYERVMVYRWYLHRTGYPARRERRSENPKGSRGIIYLHRFILGLERGNRDLVGDHIISDYEGYQLDCRRVNLRAIPKRYNDFGIAQKRFNGSKSLDLEVVE